jgi:hypothetical protein
MTTTRRADKRGPAQFPILPALHVNKVWFGPVACP